MSVAACVRPRPAGLPALKNKMRSCSRFALAVPLRTAETSAVTLSVVIITYNEEQNIGRTLASVAGLLRELGGEIIVVDSGSTDRTREIAESFGAKVFVEEWKGFAAQKNSAIEKASGDWILSLDADEDVSAELAKEIAHQLASTRLVEPRATVMDVVREIGSQVLRPAQPTEMGTEPAGRVEIAFQAFGPGEAG